MQKCKNRILIGARDRNTDGPFFRTLSVLHNNITVLIFPVNGKPELQGNVSTRECSKIHYAINQPLAHSFTKK